MSRRFHITQDDTDVVLTVDLLDRPTNRPIDVSGLAVVHLYIRADETTLVLDTAVGIKLPGETLPDGTLDLSVANLGEGGRVEFALPTSFTQRAPGYYEGEIEITESDGEIITVEDKVKLSIKPDF